MTQDQKERDKQGVTLARARPLRGLSRVTVVTQNRDVTHTDRDATPPGIASRSQVVVGEEKQAGAKAPESLAADRTAAHKAKLATDPRFAGWVGLMADGDPDPAIGAEVIRRRDEQDELKRAAYQRAIDRHEQGQHVDPEHLAEARAFCAAHPRLRRPLSSGEPA